MRSIPATSDGCGTKIGACGSPLAGGTLTVKSLTIRSSAGSLNSTIAIVLSSMSRCQAISHSGEAVRFIVFSRMS